MHCSSRSQGYLPRTKRTIDGGDCSDSGCVSEDCSKDDLVHISVVGFVARNCCVLDFMRELWGVGEGFENCPIRPGHGHFVILFIDPLLSTAIDYYDSDGHV